jgi:hypothetical protein
VLAAAERLSVFSGYTYCPSVRPSIRSFSQFFSVRQSVVCLSVRQVRDVVDECAEVSCGRPLLMLSDALKPVLRAYADKLLEKLPKEVGGWVIVVEGRRRGGRLEGRRWKIDWVAD